MPLNQKGKKQARVLALALKEENITALDTGPLARARETAGFIKAFHPSAPPFEAEGLVEMDLGAFEGMDGPRWAEQLADFPRAWRQNPASVKMPGGESLREVQERFVAALESIARSNPAASTLLVCSHNFVFLTILCHALDIPLERFRELRQGTAALNTLYLQGRHLRVEVVNDCSHLCRQEEKKTE